MMKKLQPLLASNTKYLPYIQIVATLATIAYLIGCAQQLDLWLFSILMYVFIGCLGISIGYHRLLTHKSFKTTKFWEYFCTILGMLAFTGSSIGWVGMHRDHHKYSDREGDPHSPHVGGLKTLIAAYDFEPNKWAVRKLIFDPLHAFTHEWYFGILMLWTALWILIDPVLAMHLVIIPATITIWVSTTNNWMTHKWGYVNYQTNDNSRNLWFHAILTFGEGWHNNHHARPGDYRFGKKWWEFDPSARIIDLIRIKKV